MCAAIILAGLTASYWLFQHYTRSWRLATLLIAFGAIPVALTPLWILRNSLDPFVWLKIYSVLFCACWGSWMRFAEVNEKSWLRYTIGLLLAGNILEALCVDLSSAGIAHHANAALALALLVCLPYRSSRPYVEKAACARDLRCKLPLTWIVGYTVWNWIFVWLNYPAFLGPHTAILAAALIVACRDPQLWVQARAATLGLNLIIMATSGSGWISQLPQ